MEVCGFGGLFVTVQFVQINQGQQQRLAFIRKRPPKFTTEGFACARRYPDVSGPCLFAVCNFIDEDQKVRKIVTNKGRKRKVIAVRNLEQRDGAFVGSNDAILVWIKQNRGLWQSLQHRIRIGQSIKHAVKVLRCRARGNTRFRKLRYIVIIYGGVVELSN